jgi:hypothetical protein
MPIEYPQWHRRFEVPLLALTEISMADPIPPLEAPSAQELKAAFKAFKKRLKVTRLDAESNLGGGPLSSGRDCGIVAITPPHQFSQAVWDELVRQGKLKKAGQGTYELGAG